MSDEEQIIRLLIAIADIGEPRRAVADDGWLLPYAHNEYWDYVPADMEHLIPKITEYVRTVSDEVPV